MAMVSAAASSWTVALEPRVVPQEITLKVVRTVGALFDFYDFRSAKDADEMIAQLYPHVLRRFAAIFSTGLTDLSLRVKRAFELKGQKGSLREEDVDMLVDGARFNDLFSRFPPATTEVALAARIYGGLHMSFPSVAFSYRRPDVLEELGGTDYAKEIAAGYQQAVGKPSPQEAFATLQSLCRKTLCYPELVGGLARSLLERGFHTPELMAAIRQICPRILLVAPILYLAEQGDFQGAQVWLERLEEVASSMGESGIFLGYSLKTMLLRVVELALNAGQNDFATRCLRMT